MNKAQKIANFIIRYLIFREGDTWFGVALELNLVIEAKSQSKAFEELHEAIFGYIEAIKKAKFSVSLLGQRPSKIYERKWMRAHKMYSNHSELSSVKSPYQYIVGHIATV